MKIATSELTGPALNWAVAQCEFVGPPPFVIWDGRVWEPNESYLYNPVEDWAQGGPIIEREVPMMMKTNGGEWIAQGAYDRVKDCEARRYYGPTPLIAAMRCYVASKLGGEVEIPEELT